MHRVPRAPDALSLAIERLGGTLDAATHVDFTSYDLTLPSETLAEGVGLLAEVLGQPLLTELSTEKQIIREEIRKYPGLTGRIFRMHAGGAKPKEISDWLKTGLSNKAVSERIKMARAKIVRKLAA